MSMAAVELVVRGMSCGHCVKAVTAAIQAQDPAARVEVDLPAGRIRAETGLSVAALTEIVAAEGYAAA
jgi:copper chaperone